MMICTKAMGCAMKCFQIPGIAGRNMWRILTRTRSGLALCIFVGLLMFYIVSNRIITRKIQIQKPMVNLTQPNCSKLLNGDEDAVKHAQLYQKLKPWSRLEDNYFVIATQSCENFIRNRDFSSRSTSDEETDFPLAYIITLHTNAEQFELMLRSIYMPQNFYCLHVDRKSPADFRAAIAGIANCLPNVFMASEQLEIVYGGYNRLLADIVCMKDLLKYSQKWKYVLNMCGTEMPLKTNLETVRIVKSLNGQNDIAGAKPEQQFLLERFQYVWQPDKDEERYFMRQTNLRKGPPPNNVTIFFSSAYNIFSRQFVEYATREKFPQDLLTWFNGTYTPDEHYWATLQYHSDTPGGKSETSWSSYSRAVIWKQLAPRDYPICQGRYQRDICVYGAGDLHYLSKRNVLIANKFDLNDEYLAILCIQDWLKNRKGLRNSSNSSDNQKITKVE